MTFDDIIRFPYKLDEFQSKSIHAIRNDSHVLVTAHTSAGKSTVAEYAIAHARYYKKRVIYTSPIKALSNQKYSDFKKKYKGAHGSKGESVGIMTGDIKVCPDAPILVATTEIVNNLLYTNPDYFDDVFAIILDEVHYIRDPERGHVWEEVITLSPPHVLLVMLSASIPGALGFANWVETSKGKPCELISTQYRPVPLLHHVYFEDTLKEIMDNKGNLFEKNFRYIYELWKKQQDVPVKNRPSRSRLLNNFIDDLGKRELFPALFFMFSRKKCEELALMIQKTYIDGKSLTDSINLFEYYVKKFLGEAGLQMKQVQMIRSMLLKGICVHHSGLIPVLKEIIETLFDKGWIKVMFVTETFSVGINMPTKCVVFGELTKFDGKGKRRLNADEYCQMAGRAGRRGKDTRGIVIYFPLYDMIRFNEIQTIFQGKQASVTSKFYMDPVLLLRCFAIKKSPYDLLEKSLMAHETLEYIRGLDIQENKLSNELAHSNESINKYIINEYGENTCIREVEERYKEYMIILNRLKIPMKANAKKKVLSQLSKFKDITDEIKNQYAWREDTSKSLLKLQKEKEEAKRYIKDTLEWQIKVLLETGYVHFLTEKHQEYYNKFLCNELQTLPPEVVTIKGKLASIINEADAFLVSEFMMIENTLSDDVWGIIVGTLLSGENFEEVEQSPNTLFKEWLSPETYEELSSHLSSLDNVYERLANENRLRDTSFSLCKPFGCFTHLWLKGHSYTEITNILPWTMYEGNFVRNMLKVYNIIEELKNIADIQQKNKLVILLTEMRTKIIRDIVLCDSLYVSN